MKIKTIVYRLDASGEFDKQVNAALADGWMLAKREVLQPPAQPNDGTHLYTMLYAELYAELEKRDEGEPKPALEEVKRCATCKHFNDLSGYCTGCGSGTKWELAV